MARRANVGAYEAPCDEEGDLAELRRDGRFTEPREEGEGDDAEEERDSCVVEGGGVLVVHFWHEGKGGMGLDLTIAPIHGHRFDLWVADTRLHFTAHRDLFDQIIDNAPREPIPAGVRLLWHNVASGGKDRGEVFTKEDGYGEPLEMTTAQGFIRALTPNMLREPGSPLNRAILALLRDLPDDTPVVLYWH